MHADKKFSIPSYRMLFNTYKRLYLIHNPGMYVNYTPWQAVRYVYLLGFMFSSFNKHFEMWYLSALF